MLFQISRAVFYRALRRLGRNDRAARMIDQGKDRIAPFDEYPLCDLCGSATNEKVMDAADGSTIVKCASCGLMFTSPRINEQRWMQWLREPSERSVEFTENRLKYGVALSSSIKYAWPFWKRLKHAQFKKVFDRLQGHLSWKLVRVHDVGCGVGHMMETAIKQGMKPSGNELNAYACKVMRERLGYEVYNDILPELPMERGTLDAVVMRDYIEHSYHPKKDLEAAGALLKPGGVIYVESFTVDSRPYEELGPKWHMLHWNHCYHFSNKTFADMVRAAGFEVVEMSAMHENGYIAIYGKKL